MQSENIVCLLKIQPVRLWFSLIYVVRRLRCYCPAPTSFLSRATRGWIKKGD